MEKDSVNPIGYGNFWSILQLEFAINRLLAEIIVVRYYWHQSVLFLMLASDDSIDFQPYVKRTYSGTMQNYARFVKPFKVLSVMEDDAYYLV